MMIYNLKSAMVLCLLSLFLIPSVGVTAGIGQINLSAQLEGADSINTVSVGKPVIRSLGKVEVENVLISSIVISSNQSFTINLTSQNKGHLVLQDDVFFDTKLNPTEKQKIQYKLTIAEGAGGVLGGPMPSYEKRSNLVLNNSVSIPFTMSGKTQAKQLDIMITLPRKSNLDPGKYGDKIDIEVNTLD